MKKNSSSNSLNSTNNNSKVKVLYQNLNGVWYAFAAVGDNVFFGRVPLMASSADKAKFEEEVVRSVKGRKAAASRAA